MAAKAWVLDEKEFSRRSFLRGGGSLVIGMSLAGSRAARAAGGERSGRDLRAAYRRGSRAARSDPDRLVAAGEPRQLGHALPRLGGDRAGVADRGADDRGRGARAVDGAGRARRRSTPTCRSRRSRPAAPRRSRRWARRACAAPRPRRGRCCRAWPRRSSASRPASLTVSNGVVSGGGKSIGYGAADGRQALQQHARRREPDADEPEQLQADRDAGAADRHPGDRHRADDLHPERPRPRDAPRPCRAAARPGRARSRAQPLLGIDKSSVAHIPGVQVVQKGNFVGVVAPLEWDAIQAAAQLKVSWDNTPMLPGDGNLDAALRDPANLQSAARRRRTAATSARASPAAAKTVSASYFTAYQIARSARPQLRGRRRRRQRRADPLRLAGALHPHPGVGLGGARPAREIGAGRAVPVLGHLRPQHLRRRQHLRRAALAGGRQAGARPVHALGRARLGPVRPRPGNRRPAPASTRTASSSPTTTPPTTTAGRR